jgi:glycosyltransferase involved in cell wall biosynthesis
VQQWTNPPRIAVDLTALDRPDFRLRFVDALARNAPDVSFIVLRPPTAGDGVTQLSLPNLTSISVADSPVEKFLERVDARLPAHSRRAMIGRRLEWPANLRRVQRSLRPGVLGRLGANAVLCPFTPSRVRDRSIPLVAAVDDLMHVASPHLLTSNQRARRARAFDTVSRAASRIVCSTDYVRDIALECDEVQPDRIASLPPGRLLVQPAVEAARMSKVVAKFGLIGTAFLLLPGDIERRHNHSLIMAAFAQFRARQPDSELVLVSTAADSVKREHLGVAVERMGLHPFVRFTHGASVEEMTALIGASRAVLVASLYETIGESILQAMALGRPVLCSETPSLAEITGGTALTFDQHRPDSLAHLLSDTEREPDRLDRIGDLGRQRLLARDAPADLAQSWVRILREAQCPASSR